MGIKNKLKRLENLDKQGVTTKETVLRFGKWKGCNVEYIIEQDPNWLTWAVAEGILYFDDETFQEIQIAAEIAYDNKYFD